MMKFAVALQLWLYQRLTAPQIAGVSGVFENKPQGCRYPFIQIGESDLVPDDAQGAPGASYAITLHIWSREGGKGELKTIMGEVYERTHNADVELDGLDTGFSFVEHVRDFDDPDGRTQHGVMTIQFTIRKLEI